MYSDNPTSNDSSESDENSPLAGSSTSDAAYHRNWVKAGRPDDGGGGSSSGCFVATVIYGGSDTNQVEVLRTFRDKILTQSDIGKALILLYYSGIGKTAANYIDDIPRTRKIIKRCLDVLVSRIETRKINVG